MAQGARKGVVVGQKVQTLQNLIAGTRRKNKKIYIAAMDLMKAFDMVDHEGFDDTEKVLGLDEHFRRITKALQENFSCRVRRRYGLSREIEIERGIKQGCPASPGKFTLFLEIFLRWLEDSDLGYKMKREGNEVLNVEEEEMKFEAIIHG